MSNLSAVLYDERLTYAQRHTISQALRDNAQITNAKIVGDQLYLWTTALPHPIRVTPNGTQWATT